MSDQHQSRDLLWEMIHEPDVEKRVELRRQYIEKLEADARESVERIRGPRP